MTSDDTSEGPIAAARTEARRMIETVATADPDLTVTMKVAQFRKLARLLDTIAGAAERDAERDEDTFDAPIDGIRFWVPLSHLEAERARFAAALALTATPATTDDRFSF